MNKLIELLNEKTENKYKFMLKSALFDESADFCVLEIFYRDGLILTKEIKEKLLEEIFAVLPKEVKYDITFVKNFVNSARIENETKLFLKRNFPSVSNKIESVVLSENEFKISLFVDNLSFEHAQKRNLTGLIESEFSKNYDEYKFSCKMQAADVFVEDELAAMKASYREEDVDIYENRIIEVTDLVPLVGEEVDEPASYIKDKTAETVGAIVCGKVVGARVKIINTKRKTEGENGQAEQKSSVQAEQPAGEGEEKPEYQKKLFLWTLEDFTGQIKCSFMSNKENQAKVEKIDVGSVIIVRGDLRQNKYSGDIEMQARDISYCTIPAGLTEHIEWRKEKPFYEFVSPEKMVVYKQNDLMSFAETETVPKFLENKTYVCYDFETTGLHFANGDKIIEIGAVKIENGKITEKFMSYVDPERRIPAESSAISGIVDSDVAGAPKDFEVLQDFYKFTRGAIIIGYNNINFDNVFLIGQGRKCRWNFDNETADVYKFATKFVMGVKNYKLGTIAAKLGVALDNAHRAVYDAIATAEVFLKIAQQHDLSTYK